MSKKSIEKSLGALLQAVASIGHNSGYDKHLARESAACAEEDLLVEISTLSGKKLIEFVQRGLGK